SGFPPPTTCSIDVGPAVPFLSLRAQHQEVPQSRRDGHRGGHAPAGRADRRAERGGGALPGPGAARAAGGHARPVAARLRQAAAAPGSYPYRMTQIPDVPRGRSPVPAGGTHAARGGSRFRGKAWLLLCLPVGLTTWAAFLYIGIRARRRRWLAWAAVYAAMLTGWLVLDAPAN